MSTVNDHLCENANKTRILILKSDLKLFHFLKIIFIINRTTSKFQKNTNKLHHITNQICKVPLFIINDPSKIVFTQSTVQSKLC